MLLLRNHFSCSECKRERVVSSVEVIALTHNVCLLLAVSCCCFCCYCCCCTVAVTVIAVLFCAVLCSRCCCFCVSTLSLGAYQLCGHCIVWSSLHYGSRSLTLLSSKIKRPSQRNTKQNKTVRCTYGRNKNMGRWEESAVEKR